MFLNCFFRFCFCQQRFFAFLALTLLAFTTTFLRLFLFTWFASLLWRFWWTRIVSDRCFCSNFRFFWRCYCCTLFALVAIAVAAVTIAIALVVTLVATIAITICCLFFDRRCRNGVCFFFGLAKEETHQLGKEALRRCCNWSWCNRRNHFFTFNDWRSFRCDAFHHRFLARFDIFFLTLAVADICVCLFRHGVASMVIFQAWIVVFQTVKLVVWRFQMGIRNQNNGDAVTSFNLQNLATFLIEQECSNVHRYLHVDCG